MSTNDNFRVAENAEKVSLWIFWAVTTISGILLLFPVPILESLLHPILIIAAVAGIATGALITIYQNQGNRLLRASQLSDSLGAAVGDALRADYYNSPLRKSVARLASTTMENTLFSSEVLMKMLRRERISGGVYLTVLLLLLAYRGTSLSWLVFLTQILFSADVILGWFRMERFRFRTTQVYEQLKQFFLQGGSTDAPNGMAIVLAAFTDYECAKDEAAMPLSSEVFNRINAPVSQRWEEIKKSLNITENS